MTITQTRPTPGSQRIALQRRRTRQNTQRSREERERRVLEHDTLAILRGLAAGHSVSNIHHELTRPIVSTRTAVEKAHQLEQTILRVAARDLLSADQAVAYLRQARALHSRLDATRLAKLGASVHPAYCDWLLDAQVDRALREPHRRASFGQKNARTPNTERLETNNEG